MPIFRNVLLVLVAIGLVMVGFLYLFSFLLGLVTEWPESVRFLLGLIPLYFLVQALERRQSQRLMRCSDRPEEAQRGVKMLALEDRYNDVD